jgi:hypothetical protein
MSPFRGGHRRELRPLAPIVRQQSNALKRLVTDFTSIVYHLFYRTDPPTDVQTDTAIALFSAAAHTYTARPSRVCGWIMDSVGTRPPDDPVVVGHCLEPVYKEHSCKYKVRSKVKRCDESSLKLQCC